jgi:DNA-directed RNA polymerase specialized sigma24 family protein
VLYATYGRPLTRLAALLASDEVLAAEIVRDAFVAMHGLWRQLRGSDRALRYLQETVVRRSRSFLAAGLVPPGGPPRGRPRRSPEPGPSTDEQRAAASPGPSVLAALRLLPAPQREALVLRYYADLPDTRIASVMHTSTRAVNNHIAYGMSSLRSVLGPH